MKLPTTYELKPYPEMKDSRVAWLGEVPAHWDIRRVKYLLKECDTRSTDGSEELLRVSQYTGVTLRSSTSNGDDPDTRAASLVGYKRVEPNDLVVNIMLAWNGSLGVSQFRGIASPAYCVYRFRANSHPWYFHHLLRSPTYKARIKSNSTGVVESRLRLYTDDLYRLEALVPPLPEQIAIVRFLDHADRRIQRYIRAKQKLIVLLEEQKQTIIHQAVTGKIDVRTGKPYSSYKDSGVEWLGQVPDHWKWCRLRNVVSVVTTGSRGWSSYASDTGPLFIRVANLSRGSLKLRFNDVVRLDLPNTSEAHRTRIKAGDLLISVTAYIGSVGVVPEDFEEAYVSQHVARCQPSPESCAQWLGYVLLSMIGQTHGQMSLYGGTKDGLSLDDVKNYPILLPPQCEQEQVVKWIEEELSSLVSVGESAKRQAAMVREYRTRLISDVVTGKLDVREAAANLPKEDVSGDDDKSAEEYTIEHPVL